MATNREAWISSLTVGDAVAFVTSEYDGYDRLSPAWIARRTATTITVHTCGQEIRLRADGYQGRSFTRRIVAAPADFDAYHAECARKAGEFRQLLRDRAAAKYANA